MAMRIQFWDEIGDTLFAIAVAGAIGFGAANLAVEVTKERAAFDAAAASQKVGQLVPTPQAPNAGNTEAGGTPPSALNF
jgi:hypothetical protein